MKQPKKLANEPQFNITLVVGESLVGPILRFIDNRATTVGIQIVKEVKEGRNLPHGSIKEAIIEVLSVAKGHTMSVKDFKDAVANMGFNRNFFYQKYAKQLFTRKGENVTLKKGVTQ